MSLFSMFFFISLHLQDVLGADQRLWPGVPRRRPRRCRSRSRRRGL